MPPTRRSRNSSGPAARGSQKTLSFGNSKATKPLSSTKEKLNAPASFIKPEPVEIQIDVGRITSEAAVQEHAAVELEQVQQTPEEERASKVTDAQIKKYWRAREHERRAPRVHQEGLSVEEKVLRFWDMSSQYGPAIGVARMKRWVRANKLGLNPPIEVLAILMKEEKKGNARIERAYVDELMSSKFVIGEA